MSKTTVLKAGVKRQIRVSGSYLKNGAGYDDAFRIYEPDSKGKMGEYPNYSGSAVVFKGGNISCLSGEKTIENCGRKENTYAAWMETDGEIELTK